MSTINLRETRALHRQKLRALGDELRQLREDAGLSQRAVAIAAGISQSYLSKIETGIARPSIEVLRYLLAALGADLSLRAFPNTGPRVRDRLQLPMEQALLEIAHARYRRELEVRVWRPVRGVIDAVLHDQVYPDSVATEIHSQIRRAEQLIRWANEKADAVAALPEFRGRHVCRLLVLRNTVASRDLVRASSRVFAAAYPGRASDAYAALAGESGRFPLASILWVDLAGGAARVLDHPPRGVGVGR